MIQAIGYILAAVFLVLWRFDIYQHSRERHDLYDRLQAGSLPAYDAHKERIVEQAKNHEDIESDFYDDDEHLELFTEDELEQLRVDTEAARIKTASMLHE